MCVDGEFLGEAESNRGRGRYCVSDAKSRICLYRMILWPPRLFLEVLRECRNRPGTSVREYGYPYKRQHRMQLGRRASHAKVLLEPRGRHSHRNLPVPVYLRPDVVSAMTSRNEQLLSFIRNAQYTHASPNSKVRDAHFVRLKWVVVCSMH